MLIKKPDKKGNLKLAMVWSGPEYGKAIKKFAGCLIFRGKARMARRRYEKLLCSLKRSVPDKNPAATLKDAFDNLYPLFASTQKRYGKKFINLPTFATGNRRVVMITNWLLRYHKGRTNVRGYKMEEIHRYIADASRGEGKAMAIKQSWYKSVLSARHLLAGYSREDTYNEDEDLEDDLSKYEDITLEDLERMDEIEQEKKLPKLGVRVAETLVEEEKVPVALPLLDKNEQILSSISKYKPKKDNIQMRKIVAHKGKLRAKIKNKKSKINKQK